MPTTSAHRRLPLLATLALALATTVLALLPGSAHAVRGLDRAIWDTEFLSSNDSDRALWFDRTKQAGARYSRMNAIWRNLVSNSKPANPRDPSDPAYDFSGLDRAMRGSAAVGLEPIVTVAYAPNWAEGAGRPKKAAPGSWKPSPAALGDFMTALATRYSGNYPDPLYDPGLLDPLAPKETLPKVGYYEAWNEANHNAYLEPQFKKGKAVGPAHFRKMLAASYKAVKAVSGSIKIAAPSMAPFGDGRKGPRMRPMMFLRELFCLKKNLNKAKGKCAKAKFDIVSHHPIALTGGPTYRAKHRDDVSAGDLGKIVKALRAAEKANTVKGKKHPVWVTEFWWRSQPPKGKYTVPIAKQARYVQESLYEFWSERADLVLNYVIHDVPGFAAGLYFENGGEKPSLTAFRFPFVADRKKGKKVVLWGISPASGKLVIEKKKGKGWKTVSSTRGRSGEVFKKSVRIGGSAKLRARLGNDTSLNYKLKR